METYTEMSSFKRLLVWIDGNGGEGYGCIELNTAAGKKTFIEELKMSLPEPLVEVDFSPEAGERGYEDADLIVPGRIYETMRNFEEKYPEKPLLVMSGLERTVPQDDEQVRKLALVINMNRDNFYRYPSVVLFIFPNWFMDVMFREAFDFTSAMGFHEDMEGGDEAASGGEGEAPYSFSDETVSEIPVRSLYGSYAERMRDTRLSAAERLEAAAKLVGVIEYYYLDSEEDRRLAAEAEKLIPLAAEDNREAELAKAELWSELGSYFLDRGTPKMLEKALRFYTNALRVRENLLGNQHPATAALYNNIGVVYVRTGRYEEALEFYGKALHILEQQGSSRAAQLAVTYNNTGRIYFDRGEYARALKYYMKACDISENVLGKYQPDTAVKYNNVGAAYSAMGRYTDALIYFEKALGVREQFLGAEHPDTANTYNNIAAVYEHLGEYYKASAYYEKALSILAKVLGQDHPSSVIVRRNLERLEKRKEV